MSTGIELARVWNCNVHEMIIVSDFMVGVGLSLSDLDLLTIGMVNELYAERDCGQNPRLFLKEEKDFGKVHKGRETESY